MEETANPDTYDETDSSENGAIDHGRFVISGIPRTHKRFKDENYMSAVQARVRRMCERCSEEKTLLADGKIDRETLLLADGKDGSP